MVETKALKSARGGMKRQWSDIWPWDEIGTVVVTIRIGTRDMLIFSLGHGARYNGSVRNHLSNGKKYGLFAW